MEKPTEGTTSGGAEGPEVVPEVDPGIRGQENCYKLEHRLGITQEYTRDTLQKKSQIDACATTAVVVENLF